ncbi:hypothetical protein K435DRAFT_793387 [Dendrothele bispora CBS 962.96]|uniref:Uncharacterized protein n=1 Tax=Dendrothele bispora (strain CBS 962.96) TaxID=1314807 RepID=A0A4S8MG72_DENBC|nr:hypothetical protein K435DRAFT_793387 [Dendrothele bispora CBS 962.96]
MPSPDEGSKLSGLRQRIAKISRPTARPQLKFLRRSNSRSTASSSSYSDRLASLTQSAEHYPHLKALADIVTVLYSNASVNRSNNSKKQRAIGWRSVEILEAIAEAIPDPSQISPEMCMEISHLTTLLCDVNRYFDLLMHTSTPFIQFGPLRSQLDAAYSKFVLGKKPKTFRVFHISTTTLRVIDRASDAFPPLKSAVGGVLALKDVIQNFSVLKLFKGANVSKTKAQELKREITDILDIVPSDSVDVAKYLEKLRRKSLELDELSRQSRFKRLKNLNRNNEFLSTSQTDVEHVIQKIILVGLFLNPAPAQHDMVSWIRAFNSFRPALNEF